MDIQPMQVQEAFQGDHCVEEQHCLGGRRKSISAYTLFQNGYNFSILVYMQINLVALFKGKYSFEFRV